MIDTTLLRGLIEQLHDANRQLSNAAKLLDRVSDLNLEQRSQVGDQMRAGMERWEIVTKKIRQLFAEELGLNGSTHPHNDSQVDADLGLSSGQGTS